MVLWYPKTRHLTRTNGNNFWKVQDLGDLPLARHGSMRASTPTGCSRNFERLQSALHQGLPLRGAVSRRLTERCCRSGVLRKTYGNRSCPNTSPSRCARHLPSRGGFWYGISYHHVSPGCIPQMGDVPSVLAQKNRPGWGNPGRKNDEITCEPGTCAYPASRPPG